MKEKRAGVAGRASARAQGGGGRGVWMYCVQVREYSYKLFLRVRLALYFYVRPARSSCMVICNVGSARAVPSAVCGVCAGSGGQSAEQRRGSAGTPGSAEQRGGPGAGIRGGGSLNCFVLLSP